MYTSNMYLTKSIIIKYFEDYSLILLLTLVIIISLYYFSNYLRIYYYLLKLHGPPLYPIIGNANLVFGSMEGKNKFYNNAIINMTEKKPYVRNFFTFV